MSKKLTTPPDTEGEGGEGITNTKLDNTNKFHFNFDKGKKLIYRFRAEFSIIGALLILFFVWLIVYTNNNHKSQELSHTISIFENASELFRFNNKTFVPHSADIVTATISVSENCESCALSAQEIEASLRDLIPTLSNVQIVESENLPKDVAYTPAVTFSQSVDTTEFYDRAQQFFFQHDDGYGFYVHALNISPSDYIMTPPQSELGVQNDDAENTLTLFVSPDCSECNTMNDVLTVLENKYSTKISTSYYTTNNDEEKLTHITTAIQCATNQEKGIEYLYLILNNQTSWEKSEDIQETTTAYAKNLGLLEDTFTRCIESEIVDDSEDVFDQFGVVRVPTLFINNEKLEGVQTIADIEKVLSQFETT